MVDARRCRLSRLRRLSLPHRSEDLHDHLRRREHLPAGDRGRADHPSGDCRRRGVRRAERGDGRRGQGGGAAARHEPRRQGARGGTDRVLPQASVADQMPAQHRLRGRIAAHAHRQAAQAAPARSLLAAEDDGLTTMQSLDAVLLPPAIRSRFVEGINGLRVHVLESGFDTNGPPCVLLLHGFPELAYSWRKVMPRLAAAGYHVIAPDQRGYGRTTGWDAEYDGDLGSFRLLNLVRDTLGLVSALGIRSVAAVVGHDFGSPVAAWCALLRPDVFRSVALMSAPFAGPPALPFNTADAPPTPNQDDPLHRDLAALPH